MNLIVEVVVALFVLLLQRVVRIILSRVKLVRACYVLLRLQRPTRKKGELASVFVLLCPSKASAFVLVIVKHDLEIEKGELALLLQIGGKHSHSISGSVPLGDARDERGLSPQIRLHKLPARLERQHLHFCQ